MRKSQPNYHTVKECLMHDFESCVRDYWLLETETNTLDELRDWIADPMHTAEDILAVAKRIQCTWVSRMALPLYEINLRHSGKDLDAVLVNSLLQNQDMELFRDLRHAVKHGNVGHMEDLLPDLLVFFTGGRKNRFYPVDQRQELNNGGIRSHGPVPQGGTSWDDIEKASPLIPLYMDIVKHVEDSITGVQRSQIHKDPKWEKDLQLLMCDQATTKALVPVPGWDLATTSKPCNDHYQLGLTILQDTNAMDRYAVQRECQSPKDMKDN
ncbi:hypothetical protein FRC07_008592 [Ceratobasidium sp. 392]|nr:hypothetical protein FRC07_008592 [Ceratobasidium sp. 392]